MVAKARPIRVGVVGVGRGQSFAQTAKYVGMELVAFCDMWEERLREQACRYRVAAYTDYDAFLEHDVDAVILANYFHQHAPLAIKALEAGKHVMSETSACKTLGEGVALARAVEKSGRIYMLAENYPYSAVNQEMRRLYHADEIGEVRYAEGEYIHPMETVSKLQLSPGLKHWRNHCPSTYYCTHSLAPLMVITNTMPLSVNALSIAEANPAQRSVRVTDPASVILCRMDNGAVFRLVQVNLAGHSYYYRLHGTRGMMEHVRGHEGRLRIIHEEWDRRPSDLAEVIYRPDFPEHADLARAAGHAGGDFFTTYYFAEAIRSGEPPYLDVYRGLAMSVVGILAWRSALENGAPYAVPDFRSEAARKQYEHDDWSPWPEDRRPGQPWPSIEGEIVPTPEAIAIARRVWAEMGYHGE
ncbi:MAG: Gfo/Idh/MocA family protein [Anaerolineae bacterium]